MVLSAISLPSYGLDTGTNLVELVEKCAQVPGIERIRLGSLDPDMLTPEFISRLAAVDKLCPPVPPEFAERLHRHPAPDAPGVHRAGVRTGGGADPRRLRQPPGQLYHRLHLRLPRRDAEDFEESCEFLKKIGFLKVHVFPYSRRSGTPGL